jgi:hypothetical protein
VEEQARQTRETQAGPRLARELGGDLLCIGCRYNLKGLSVRAACPECGRPVLATVLAVVDPHASELRPIRLARLIATGLVAWAAAAFLATLVVWADQAPRGLEPFGVELRSPHWLGAISTGLIIVSGIASLVLIRPHAGLRTASIAMAAGGCLIYAPIAWLNWRIHGVVDRIGESFDGERLVLRAMLAFLAAAVIMLLRANARTLAARSLVMRTGRVDRQSLLPLAAALIGITIVDLLAFVAMDVTARVQDLVLLANGLVVAAAGVLFTIGLWGIVLDTFRLWPVIAKPPVRPGELLRDSARGGDA